MEDMNWITTYNSFKVLSRVAGGFIPKQAHTHHVCIHINSTSDHVLKIIFLLLSKKDNIAGMMKQ